jgi:hypothetical protein
MAALLTFCRVRIAIFIYLLENRLCPDCYSANEQQLADWRVKKFDTVNTSESAGESFRTINGAMHKLDDAGPPSENKELKLKQVKGKKNKHEEMTVQQRAFFNDGDRNELGADVTATAPVTDVNLS